MGDVRTVRLRPLSRPCICGQSQSHTYTIICRVLLMPPWRFGHRAPYSLLMPVLYARRSQNAAFFLSSSSPLIYYLSTTSVFSGTWHWKTYDTPLLLSPDHARHHTPYTYIQSTSRYLLQVEFIVAPVRRAAPSPRDNAGQRSS